MRRICTICVRAGSQGVKGKNHRLMAGKPLFQHSLEHAIDSKLFDWVAISSDDQFILSSALDMGADQVIERPDELATAQAGKLPAILHAVMEAEITSETEFDTMVDLDATSPLRNISDIIGAVELLESSDAENIITGAPSHRSPYFNMVELDREGLVKLSKKQNVDILRRQDAPICFDMNASIYVWKRKYFFPMPKVFSNRTKLYEMPTERSLDIDTELDFELVNYLMNRKIQQD